MFAYDSNDKVGMLRSINYAAHRKGVGIAANDILCPAERCL